MCGVHRTGPFLACADEGIAPDIVTLAKGLGGGYLRHWRGRLFARGA